ncbi:MAG: glycosyltransferase family 2 protein [Phycisphaerae bacterium]|nr:glycosyltransferase family 2 protein [Phycisphaerae bacterium]
MTRPGEQPPGRQVQGAWPHFLSIIIPAYNEERRLPVALEKIGAFLATQSFPAEVLVVDNGSGDRTRDAASAYADRLPTLHVLREERRGKGLAVRRGMLTARGQYRFLCDVDLSMPIEQVLRFLPPQREGCDVGIGSREAAESEVVDRPLRRKVGRAFNLLVRCLHLTHHRDTQCGFKCFTAEAAEDIFRRQRLDGLAFDAEVLFLAERRGYRVEDVPISWRIDPDTRVRLLTDAVKMGIDLFRVRWNAWRGLYDERDDRNGPKA